MHGSILYVYASLNFQIKIALSVDKVCILIKILAESHMAVDLGDKIDIRKCQFYQVYRRLNVF